MSAEILERPAGAAYQGALATLGMATPVQRFAVGTAIGALIVYAARPSISFYQDGTPKPWALTAAESEDSTSVPFWALAALPGVLGAVFL